MNNPAKIYLQQYRAARVRYASMCREIEYWRESLTGTTVQLKDDVVSGGGVSDRMAATVAKIIDAQSQLANEAAEVSRALAAVLEAIRNVPDETQRTILTLRYIEGLNWITIAEKMNYSEARTYVIHGRALISVNEWIKAEEKKREEKIVVKLL